MEVKSVVFKGDLVENVYMQQTEGGIFKEEVLILFLLMCSPLGGSWHYGGLA